MITLKNLSIGYNQQVVLTLQHLELQNKNHYLLCGDSGCGKTTLLHTICGFIKPLSGEIIIDNTNICKLSEGQMDSFRGQNIGIIFQNLHLIKSLNIVDNLLLGCYFTGRNNNTELAMEILHSLKIDHLAKKFPYQISQGQAQRLAIARAVLLKPKLILADEPTANLDDKNCQIVIYLLKETATQNQSTLVISTHDQRLKNSFSEIINL